MSEGLITGLGFLTSSFGFSCIRPQEFRKIHIQPKYVIYHAIWKQCLSVFNWFFSFACNKPLPVSLPLSLFPNPLHIWLLSRTRPHIYMSKTFQSFMAINVRPPVDWWWTPSILYISLLPASCTCESSGDSTTAARRPNTALIRWLIGQHAGAASVRPEPSRSSNILQGKLLSLSKTSGRTGELSG